MDKPEEVVANKKHWERMVKERCGYTIPWLDLDVNIIRKYSRGELDNAPDKISVITPKSILTDMEGKDVLCLAAGGGQQSAVFGSLGANVTVVDIAQGQLDADQKAAKHYGYKIKTIQGDMQDLSCLDDDSFDLVYGTAICYVSDIQKVYSEVSRVLRRDGLFRVDFGQPAIHFIKWDGEGYQIYKPYCESLDLREDGAIEFRHYMDDIFNRLIEVGLTIIEVEDLSRNRKPDKEFPPGSWNHENSYVGGSFVIISQKT
ncbi:methyltransferase domain-containing protein [Candidatus Poribacteria bacterium]|nr:methyltransferase domain-containing protein [Candidatus Poribacteria bacterium]